MSTIDICREFYETKIATMIHAKFPEYEERIAVGLAGEGSECWGYDDRISKDHDFGVGLCLWLTEKDYNEIGNELNREYLKIAGDTAGTRLSYRRGVLKIGDFYSNILGLKLEEGSQTLTMGEWFYTDDSKFATAVNGEVFRDDIGYFSEIRERLQDYYPERIWRMKLVEALHAFSASAQANYPRCMARGDSVAASICVRKGIESAMAIAFLLKKTYAPYYKWTYRALCDLWTDTNNSENDLLALLKDVSIMTPQQEAWQNYRYDPRWVNKNDSICETFENIAKILADEMKRMNLITNDETFLEAHCRTIQK